MAIAVIFTFLFGHIRWPSVIFTFFQDDSLSANHGLIKDEEA